METLDAGSAWIDRFRSDIVALARVEGEMPSKAQLRAFMVELEDVLDPDKGLPTEALFGSFNERWWERFSKLEIKRARRAARLHVRLHELYQGMKGASDEDVAAYARLREQTRMSVVKPLMTDLLARRRARDPDEPPSCTPRAPL